MTDVGPTLGANEATAPEQGTQAANERARRALPPLQRGFPPPGRRGSMTRPTERPGEPVTAGLSTGPGVGPRGANLSTTDKIRAVYRAYPTEGLRRIIEHLDRVDAAKRFPATPRMNRRLGNLGLPAVQPQQPFVNPTSGSPLPERIRSDLEPSGNIERRDQPPPTPPTGTLPSRSGAKEIQEPPVDLGKT